MRAGVEQLLGELAMKGTLLLITGGGWLVYAAGELNTAPCPTCGRMAGFYAIRQVLDETKGYRLVWEGSCLGCARMTCVSEVHQRASAVESALLSELARRAQDSEC